jgi:ribonuclease BN (tRNA processing enzyme)
LSELVWVQYLVGQHVTISDANKQPGSPAPISVTQIVMLGTGTPRPDPDRSGPATVIVVNGRPYLFDCGPGIIRRAVAAYNKGVLAIGPAAVNLRTVFVTHLHADHTVGYPDVILTPWILGRKDPVDVYGPKGVEDMTRHVLSAWKVDIDNRLNGIDRLPASGCAVNAHEIGPGMFYKDENIRVSAFCVRHAGLENAFGFRVETPHKTIVFSGDTAPTQSLLDNCHGCDVLIHEAYSQATYDKVAPKWQAYRRENHTSSTELADLATRVRPRLLILTHRVNIGAAMVMPDPEDVLLEEVRRLYKGNVVTGHDLDIF